MKTTKTGFLVPCVNCQKEFNSKGLRCCSKECEKQLRAKFKRLALIDLPSRLYPNLEILGEGSTDLAIMITKEKIAS
jgi:hypothetical protein